MSWYDYSLEEWMFIMTGGPFFIGLSLGVFGASSVEIKLIRLPGEDGFSGSMIKIQEQMNEFNELAKRK